MPGKNNGADEKPPIKMLTLSQAIEYAGVSKTKLKSALDHKRFNPSIFNSATVHVTHFHPEVPDLIEIDPAALDAWKIEREKPRERRLNVPADKPRRYEIKFPALQLEAVKAALAPLGIEVAVAYKSRAGKKRGANASAPEASAPSAEETNAPVVDANAPVQTVDLGEVGDLVSA